VHCIHFATNLTPAGMGPQRKDVPAVAGLVGATPGGLRLRAATVRSERWVEEIAPCSQCPLSTPSTPVATESRSQYTVLTRE
jgi:hypothetical protein